MSHENIPILIITAPPRSPDTQNIDHVNQALKQHPASQKRGSHIKSNIKRPRNSKQNDKSEPIRRNEISNSYNNVSLLSIEKKLHDESCLDNISNSSRSIFSTESPRDLKTISSLKQKSYYLGVINHNEGSRLSQQNPKSSFAGKSVFPSITLDESHANLHKNETLVGGENGQKNTSKVQSLNVIQSKRSSSIGLKFYHGFRKTYASQNLTDQTESFDITRLHSPQQKDLILPSSVNIDKQKSTEEANHIPKPPSKDQPKKSKTLAPPALDHRRSRRVITEPSSTIMKTNTELDSKTLNSLPVDTVAPSLLSLPINDMTLESGHLITESDWVSKHRKLKLDAEKKPATRLSLDPLGTKENYLSSQTDLSNPQTYHHTMKIPLKPLSNNINGSVKRSSIIKPPSSEMRPSSREDLMRRFNEIVTSHTQPAQQGNQQEKNKNERQTLKPINMKEKENNFRKSLKKQQDENGTGIVGSKTKKSAEISAALSTDAKIMLLKSKIKDSEYKRKTRKNQRIEEGECDLNGLPLKSKTNEQLENKAEVEEEMKKKLLVMRKIQLYDILIKQKVGKKLPKEALRLVKAEFDKVNVELNELKMQHD